MMYALSLPVVVKYSGYSTDQITRCQFYKPLLSTLANAPDFVLRPYYAWCDQFDARFVIWMVIGIHNNTLFRTIGDPDTECDINVNEIP